MSAPITFAFYGRTIELPGDLPRTRDELQALYVKAIFEGAKAADTIPGGAAKTERVHRISETSDGLVVRSWDEPIK